MNEPNEFVIYEFGVFRVDTLKRQLSRGGVPIPLTSKAFDTLVSLVKNYGDTVSKKDLMDSVWGETAVEENNLTQQISILRKALGERAGDHRFIVTVSGRGYCFVAPVVRQNDLDIDRLERRQGLVRSLFKSSFLFGYGLGIVYVIAVCLPAFFLDWHGGFQTNKPQSIAILRFRSVDVGDDLLGMGIRDTLRAKLGSLDDVVVRPDNAELRSDDAIDAARRMNVDVVLTGSVQRDVDRVRVAVEMVDVSSQRVLWGSTFDENLSNAFELQDSIVDAVVGALRRPRSTGALREGREAATTSNYPFVDLLAGTIIFRRTYASTTSSC